MAIAPSLWLQRVSHGALDLLFPPSCNACRVELPAGPDRIALCDACRQQLPPVDWAVCRRCAARVPEIPGAVAECVSCRNPRLHFDQTLAFGSYDGLLRELVLRMKRDRSERLAHTFAEMIARRWGEAIGKLAPDAVVPVPMHPWRRLSRGTNPAAALAVELSRRLGLRSHSRMLRRRRNTRPQLGLSTAGRCRNVRGELEMAAGYHLEAAHVLLVDDVMTTGATCSEAAKILKQAGAAQVTVSVVARTPIH